MNLISRNWFIFCSIILESDPILVAQRVAFRSDDIPLGEQTVASVCYSSFLPSFQYPPCFIVLCFIIYFVMLA